jgi:hypothetical protein
MKRYFNKNIYFVYLRIEYIFILIPVFQDSQYSV